jgi:hypothetical protein
MTFVAFSDASFGCRADLASQGGFLLLMVNKNVAEGTEGYYNILDWRSWKLARIARSTLAAESQAASEAADALLFTCTFWNLVWKPWLPLDRLETAKIYNNPKLVVDAKALYDMLIRPDVQATSGSDKRTTIEVLVTQDKLSCCGADTLWVSSERQYSDGLTKQSAAQLLADRMRTHLVKLKSDENFQAAKRKDAKERKKSAEMYAAKRPGRAMVAMFATCMAKACAAEETDIKYNLTHFTYIDLNLNIVHFVILTIMAIVFSTWWMTGRWAPWTPTTRAHAEPDAEVEPLQEESRPAEGAAEMPRFREIGVETELRMGDIMEVREHLASLEDIDHDYITRDAHDRTVEALERDHLLVAQHRCRHPIYFTDSGRCWHANYFCLKRHATTRIHQRDYCSLCSHELGDCMVPQDWERTL